jgi:hypothetical protein
VNRRRWLALFAAILVLILGGPMVLRYLDYQATEASRAAATLPAAPPA